MKIASIGTPKTFAPVCVFNRLMADGTYFDCIYQDCEIKYYLPTLYKMVSGIPDELCGAIMFEGEMFL